MLKLTHSIKFITPQNNASLKSVHYFGSVERTWRSLIHSLAISMDGNRATEMRRCSLFKRHQSLNCTNNLVTRWMWNKIVRTPKTDDMMFSCHTTVTLSHGLFFSSFSFLACRTVHIFGMTFWFVVMHSLYEVNDCGDFCQIIQKIVRFIVHSSRWNSKQHR